MVRLYSPVSALELREATREGGEARFTGIPVGDYRVEVTSPGFDSAEESTEVMPGGTMTLFITLRAEGTSAASHSQPASGAVLSPKARKELEKGIVALNQGKFAEARSFFEKVQKMAPGHPEPHYLLAVVAFREQKIPEAEAGLKNALNLFPKHSGANALLGRILLQRNEVPGAIRAFEAALTEDASVWENHALIANAYMSNQQYARAREHAGRALEQSAGRIPQLRILLADALAHLGEKEKAASELEAFLASHANHAAAPQARALLARVKPSSAASLEVLVAASSAAPAPSAAAAMVPAPGPKIVEGNWAPKDVDEMKPFVAVDVSCSLPEVMKSAGQRVLQLAENLQGVSANEQVDHSELDENGIAKSTLSKQFVYMVSIDKIGRGLLSVDEMRDGRQGYDNFPTQMATRGLAALALVFHPEYAKDLEFRCEGLGQWKGQPVWQVYFKQRGGRENRIRSYHTRQGRFPVALKGRAWIAANSYQIVRLETDLVEPIQRAELEREHITVEYQPVNFKERKLQLWLPESAEMHSKLAGKRYRHKHMFTNFTYFSVDTRQKISEPKLPPEPPSL